MAVSRINEAGLNINQYGNRNLIINGEMKVSQRGTSFAGITATQYTLDRHIVKINGTLTTTVTQESDGPDGYANSLKINIDAANASLSSGNFFTMEQLMEGQDLQALKKGTANALPVTLSFWVKSNVTGTFIVEFDDNDNSRNINKSYTVNSSGTWEHKTITFEGDTSGVLDDDNAHSARIIWWLDAGSSFRSGTLATSWESTNNADRVVGNVNFANANNNYWQITGVQLEVGDTATDFEHRSFGDELARCQRYYYQITATASTNPIFAAAWWDDTTTARGTVFLPCTMRTAPSVSYSTLANLQALDPNVVWNNFTAVNLTSESSEYTAHLSVTTGGGGTNSDASSFRVIGTDNINFSAEL